MKLAFALFRYFPYGGLSYNFLSIVKVCLARGHQVRVYTHSWEGEMPDGVSVVMVPKQGISNYVRQQAFSQFVEEHLQRYPMDLLIGFNKMPGLDVYYTADNCLAEKLQDRWYTWLPRYKHFLAYEEAVFRAPAATKIMLIADQQKLEYQRHYATPTERLLLLPPGIKRDRCAHPGSDAEGQRMRESLGINAQTHVLLALGSGFKTKGLDRSLQAVADLPDTLKNNILLLVVGQDNFKPFAAMAKRLSIASQVHYLGPRHDIPQLLFAADLLVHPAYNEAAGMGLLEAGVAGLPVLASAACGFAHYIEEYDFGCVIKEPFQQSEYYDKLVAILQDDESRRRWSANGIRFGQEQPIYDRAERAADFIEAQFEQRDAI